MAEEELKKPEAESTAVPVAVEKEVSMEEKTVIRSAGKKGDDSEFMVVVENISFVNLQKEKTLSFIKAWEENEKLKAEHKSQKRRSVVAAWENSKKADTEAKLKKIKENLEKKKAESAEKMKNKVALIHMQAEDKRAIIEARRGQELLKADQTATRFRETGKTPNNGCFLLPCFRY